MKLKQVAAIAILGLLIIPVLLKQVIPADRRKYEWVSLSETSYREIQFRNEEQGLNLGGLLFIPEGPGPFPSVVIIHGSGTSQRDNGWYLTLTHYLQENGVLVLLPDKRGSEKSEGNWRTSSFLDLATDTKAATSFLLHENNQLVSSIGIIGMSQGGHIAPLVATNEPNIEFVVNVVGGATSMFQALYYEENNNLREMGFLPGFSHGLALLTTYSIRKIRQREFWDKVGNFDAVPFWKEITIPSLVLYGENDTNVPSKKSAEILAGLNKPNIEIRVYKDSGHALESPGEMGNLIFREDAMNDILVFVHNIVN